MQDQTSNTIVMHESVAHDWELTCDILLKYGAGSSVCWSGCTLWVPTSCSIAIVIPSPWHCCWSGGVQNYSAHGYTHAVHGAPTIDKALHMWFCRFDVQIRCLRHPLPNTHPTLPRADDIIGPSKLTDILYCFAACQGWRCFTKVNIWFYKNQSPEGYVLISCVDGCSRCHLGF